jgi:hypothetical protein
MRNISLDIIVIEICSARGFPSKRQVNIAIDNQISHLGVILVLLWYYSSIVMVISLFLYHF